MDNFDWRNTININLQVLRIAGLWPEGYKAYEPNLYLSYAILATLIIIGGHNLTQIVNIFYVYTDLVALTGTIFVAATNTFSIIKRYYFVKNLSTIKKLFLTLNTDPFMPRNYRHVELIEKSAKEWKRAYVGFTIIGFTNVALWLLVPVMNGWVKDHKLPFESWYPFRVDTFPYYELAYAYQIVCISYIVLSNLNVDTLIYAFMMFIGSQCDMLTDDLKNLPVRDSFADELTKCLKHHKEILNFAEESNNIFNIIIFGQIATSTATLALSMFQLSLVDISSGPALGHLAYIFGMSTEIFLYCWFGNEVTLKSSQIPNAVYESQWIGQSSSSIRNLVILCERCQRPIRITAMNLFTFSLETFIAILRSAWSYFAVLSTVNNK